MSVQNQTSFTTVYTKGVLTVEASAPHPNFSHLINCNCKTIGAEHKERSFLLKKVNFYKFREYMETTEGVNWYNWYMSNRALPAFNEALASYINHDEQRTAKYVCKTGSKIDALTYNILTTTEAINKQTA